MKKVEIDKDIVEFLHAREATPDEPLNAILRRELTVPQEQVTVELDDQTYAFLASLSAAVGESASDILRRRLQMAASPAPPSPPVPPVPQSPPAPPAPEPQTIDFLIPADGAIWNTADTALRARVGDTLMVHNNDVVPHMLITAGAPFVNVSNRIPAQARSALLLVAPYDAVVSGPLDNQGAGFWIVVD